MADAGRDMENIVRAISNILVAASLRMASGAAPIVCSIDANFGGGVVYRTEPDQRIHDVGIESLRLVSERSGTGHGWAGANMVFWNCRSSSIDCQKPPTANNYCIGCTGNIRGSGHVESKGTPVRPRSLYLKQLQDRLGLQAVKNVATEAQLSGAVDHLIRQRFSRAVSQGASSKPDAGDGK